MRATAGDALICVNDSHKTTFADIKKLIAGTRARLLPALQKDAGGG